MEKTATCPLRGIPLAKSSSISSSYLFKTFPVDQNIYVAETAPVSCAFQAAVATGGGCSTAFLLSVFSAGFQLK